MTMALPRIAPVGDRPLDVLAVVADPITREAVRQVAAQLGWPQNRVREGGLAAAVAQLQGQPAPSVLLVDVSDCEDVLAGMDALAEVCEAHTRVVAIGTANDIGLYRALVGLGVSDYLVKPVSGEVLADALRRAERTERTAGPAVQRGRTIALIGARGGVGTTTLAVSLAWSLAHERAQNAALLDLDLQFGAAALSLDLEPGRGLRELLAHPDRIDSLLIGAAVAPESERLKVLGAEEPLDTEVRPGPEGLEALLGALTEDDQAVVIDAPRRLDPLIRAALAQADMVGVVTDLSLPGMRDTQRLLGLLAALRGDAATLVIGNRLGAVAGEVPRAEFERGIGRKLDVAVPADPKAAAAAAEQGKALLAVARQGPAAAELRRLVQAFAGETAEAPAKEPLLKRLLGK